MMIKGLHYLLRSFLKEQAPNQRKLQKSKLLIYDEYLNKYVSAEELLIPGVKEINKGAVTLTKSKRLLVFDLLFKKFVNPKLDLLIPGIKSLDHVIKGDTSSKQENIKTSSRDFFWGKKTVKKHAVFPLPPVHSKPITDTEPPTVGWAGQKTKKPDTDPRPEISKPECRLGPGKDPKKKKPPKKKKKKNKYLICGKVKEPSKNIEDGNNKTDAVQTSKGISKASKEIVYNEENCYSDLKEKGKQLKSSDSVSNVSNTPLKSLIKEEQFVEHLIKNSEKTQMSYDSMFKIMCSKLFSKNLNTKAPIKRKSISDSHSKMNECDVKSNTTSLTKNKKGNNDSQKECNENKSAINQDTNFKSNQSKALVCKKQWPNSLIPSEDTRTTNHYLCKDKVVKPKTENQLCKPVCKKKVFSSETSGTKRDQVVPLNYKKEEKDKTNNTHTCFNKPKVVDFNKNNSIKDSIIDKIKHECKKAITKRPNTTPMGTPDSSKVKDQTTSNNTQSDVNKSGNLPYNFIERPKTACFQKTCPKATLLTSRKSIGDCDSNYTHFIQENKKCENKNEKPGKCSSAEKSKVKEKCNEKSELENHKSLESKTSKSIIDPESSEKLQCITQEEFFKRANVSTDLNKCSSYLGFKVKNQSSETNSVAEISCNNKKIDCKNTPDKEVPCKKRKKSKTDLKTAKSNDTIVQSETNRKSLKASKSETCINEDRTKQTLNNEPQDCKELSASTCKNDVSLSNAKKKSKSKIVRGSDSKGNIQKTKKKVSKNKSQTKLSKKCKSKSTLGVKAANLKSKEIGKIKNILHTSKTQLDNKQPNEKPSPCSKPSVSSEKKDLQENINYDSGKNECCCKDLTNNTALAQEKQICCTKTNKETDKSYIEKSPYERQLTSGKVTVQCHTAKTNSNETTIKTNNVGEHKSKEIKKDWNKCIPKLKNIITGATHRKKAHLCKKNKSLQSYKFQGKQNKINETKMKNTLPEDSLQKIKRSKSENVCSEKKSSDKMEEHSKKSKSKHSICSRKGKGNLIEHSKNQIKSKKGENLSKLNKLVRRAKCSAASANRKEKPVKHALICSKSSPSIQPVKNNKIPGFSKPNGTISKKPSTSNTSDKKSQKAKASHNEIKSSKICSLHTLQKRMTETPMKTSKGINVKSFSELKTVNNSTAKDIAPDHFSSSSYSLKLNSQCNKQKIETVNNCKDTRVKEDCILKNTKQKTEQNCLKSPTQAKTESVDQKNKNFSPSLKDYKYFQQFLTSLKHETEAMKHVPKDTLRLGQDKASKNENVVPSRHGEGKLLTKSLNTVKEYSNNSLTIRNSKNQYRTNSISLVSKDSTGNVNEFYKINNTVKESNIQTKDASANNCDIPSSNKITNESFQVNDKFKDGTLVSNGNTSSIIRKITTETCLTKEFAKVQEPRNRPYRATVSKFQLKARNTSNIADTSNTVTQPLISTSRAKSAAATESLNDTVNIPHNTLSPSKTKSFSSLNAFKLCDTVTKQDTSPLQSPKSETNKDLEKKMLNKKNCQDKKGYTSKMSQDPQNKISDKSQLHFTKSDKDANGTENNTSHVHDKIEVDYELVLPKKLQSLQVNEPEYTMNRNNSTYQTNGRKNNVCNETILCDFIDGSVDVNGQNIEPHRLKKHSKNISQCQHTKNLENKAEVHSSVKDNKTKPSINVSKNIVKYNDANKKESSIATRDNSTNKTLIDGLENHTFKLNPIVPFMKRISKPVFLNSEISVGNENPKLNNKISVVNTSIKDKTFEKIKNTGPETESKAIQENNSNRQTKSSDLNEIECERKVANVSKIFTTHNNNEKVQEIPSNQSLLQPKLQKDVIKVDYALKQEIASKTPLKIKYSQKLKTKMQLISKRHRKFTIYNHKKSHSTAAKIDSGVCEKPEPKETIKTHSDISNENKNADKKDNKAHCNTTTSLSSKQSMLLMDQPFLKKPKPKPSTDPILHISKPVISLVASNKDNTKESLPPKQSASQSRLLLEQPVYERRNSEPFSQNVLHISKPGDMVASNKHIAKGFSFPKQPAEKPKYQAKQPVFFKRPKSKPSSESVVHTSKPETGVVASNKDNTKESSSRKQSASQSRLLIERPAYKRSNSEPSPEKMWRFSKPETGMDASNMNAKGSSSPKQPVSQLRLLMDQPFYKKPKHEHSNNPVSHMHKSETAIVASNKDNTKGISYPKQPVAQPKYLAKQPVFIRPKSKPSSESVVHTSKPETGVAKEPAAQTKYQAKKSVFKRPNSKPSSENVAHTSKPETCMFVSNKDNTKSPLSNNQPAKQIRLLMEQPFYKIFKSESSSANVLHTPKPENSMFSSNKDNTKGISSPKQPERESRSLVKQPVSKGPKSETSSANVLHIPKPESVIVASDKGNREGSVSAIQPTRQLRLLMEQPFYKQLKSEPNTQHSLHSSESGHSIPKPKHETENELCIAKSESNLVGSNKDNGGDISPRKQQNSIRSQLQRKIPPKAVIQVNLKNKEQDK